MKVVVVSAHPDDEVIGCGGSLLKHKANGDELAWIIVTDTLERFGYSKERVKNRQEEIEKIKNEMGFNKVFKMDYPPQGLDSGLLITLIAKISEFFNEFKPEVVYVMNRSDVHSDHRITFDAVSACTKSFRYPFIKKVLMYECISETEFAPALAENVFLPNYFVDISGFMTRKLELMKIYSSELGDHPFPRSIENIKALAHFRGATAGVKYAEAFQLLKWIEK